MKIFKSMARFIAMLIVALVISQTLIGLSADQSAINQVAMINACGFGLLISLVAFYVAYNQKP